MHRNPTRDEIMLQPPSQAPTDPNFEEFEYPFDVPEELTEGGVAVVRMIEGEGEKIDVPLFIRSHLIKKEHEIKKFLSSDSLRHLYVSGPPGSGKTAFLTLVAHRYAKKESKRVLMINYRDITSCHIFILEGPKATILQQHINRKKIVAVVRQLLKENDKFDLCVFDGVRYNTKECSDLISVINTRTGAGAKTDIGKVIHTTSLQFHIPHSDQRQGIGKRMKRVSFDSFTEQDHKEAIGSEAFLNLLSKHRDEILNDIRKWQKKQKQLLEPESDAGSDQTADAGMGETKEDVDPGDGGEPDLIQAAVDYANHKFFYSGGSARFMFDFTTEGLKEELQHLMDRVTDWKELTSTSVAPSATNAVNSLMQQFSGKAIAVSKFVLFEAYNHAERELVGAVGTVAKATGNPALRGWAFELEQLSIIKAVLKENGLGIGRKVVASEEGLDFRPVSGCEAYFDGATLERDGGRTLGTGTVIWCWKWNQGCFDVAFFKGGTLMTLKFTISTDHSIKLQYIRGLKEAVDSLEQVNKCFHIGVVGDPYNLDDFDFKNPEGFGCECWWPDFKVIAMKSSALFEADEKAENAENYSATPIRDYQMYTKNTKKRRSSSD